MFLNYFQLAFLLMDQCEYNGGEGQMMMKHNIMEAMILGMWNCLNCVFGHSHDAVYTNSTAICIDTKQVLSKTIYLNVICFTRIGFLS